MLERGVYKLKPAPVPKPWGGGHLDELAGKITGESIGEYVLFSDLDQFPVQVEVNGESLPLSKFWGSLGLEQREIPFMLKILSTAEPISLQNHPSDADIKPLGLTGDGKFECWTMLECDANARAYLGLKKGENREVLRSLEADEKPLSHFNEVKVRPGDVVTLNPGLVHSTTGKLLFYEIQQKSDHTFRIYDFGRGRELHLDQAIFCMRNQEPQIGTFAQPLRTDKFRVDYIKVQDKVAFSRKGREFSVLTWLGEAASMKYGNQDFPLQWGDSLLVLTDKVCTIDITGSAASERTAKLPMIDMLFEAYV